MSEWTTNKQREAAVTTMRVLAHVKKLPADKLTKKLSEPEKGVYKRSSDAKKVIKKLVEGDAFPVEKEGRFVKRTDLNTSEVSN